MKDSSRSWESSMQASLEDEPSRRARRGGYVPPRHLTDEDVSTFEEAATHRGVAGLPPAWVSFDRYMRRRNWWRWRRLRADMRWARRAARRYGLDPDDLGRLV
jgi:hypothetical protein